MSKSPSPSLESKEETSINIRGNFSKNPIPYGKSNNVFQ